jgi:hypothetical protein
LVVGILRRKNSQEKMSWNRWENEPHLASNFGCTRFAFFFWQLIFWLLIMTYHRWPNNEFLQSRDWIMLVSIVTSLSPQW